jgi:hypothetical protein
MANAKEERSAPRVGDVRGMAEEAFDSGLHCAEAVASALAPLAGHRSAGRAFASCLSPSCPTRRRFGTQYRSLRG